MLSVDGFIAEWRRETRICIALAGKVPPGGLDYRPSPVQRSAQELMRYLAYGPYNGVRRVVLGDWNIGRPTAEVVAGMPASDFAARMAWQADEVERLVRSAAPGDLRDLDMAFPWGETLKRGQALMTPYRWLVGYKMQLFLYLKAAGNHQLGTADVWRTPAA